MEIEITEEMLQVGADVVSFYEPDYMSSKELAQQVYLAMARVKIRLKDISLSMPESSEIPLETQGQHF